MNEQIETKVEVKAFRVNLVCQVCGEGNMISCEGAIQLCNPPNYPHKCDSCGYRRYVSEKMYPYTLILRMKRYLNE